MSAITSEQAAILRENTGLVSGFLQGLEVPPAITPTEWAAENFVLSSDTSSEPGKFNPRRAAYQPGMLNAIIEPHVKKIVHMCSAQVGKTITLLITIGYIATRKPAPMMFASGTKDMAEQFAKERLAMAIRDVPAMAKVFPDESTRTKGNKILYKKFAGGFLVLAGANAPRTMRARAIKIALADEVDDWHGQAGKEGDPLELLEKRTTTFWDSRLLAASTPVDKHNSRINRLYEESDKRKFVVPCPDCDHFQVLEWKVDKESKTGFKPINVHWEKGKPGTAHYQCEKCGVLLDDLQLKNAVRQGHWKATAEFTGVAGFWIWELYSPWSSLQKIVAAYERAVGYADRLKVFVNTTLGLPWEGQIVGNLELETLKARREPTFVEGEAFSPYRVPMKAGVVTAGVDVQHDRLEYSVWFWGLNDERWVAEHRQLIGDPSGPRVWAQLEEQLLRTYTHESGKELRIEAVALDSGGAHTQQVYGFAAHNLALERLWWAIKGQGGQGVPIWKISKISLGNAIPLIMVGVDAAKESVYSSLAQHDRREPNYTHLPATFTEDNLKRLTAEKMIVETSPTGHSKTVWHCPEGARNEELDCAAYAKAAFVSLNVDMDARLAEIQAPAPQAVDYAELAKAFA